MTHDTLREACIEAWTAEGLSDKTIHAYLVILDRAERWLAERGSSVLTCKPSEIRELAETFPLSRSSRMQLRTALARAWEVAGQVGPTRAVRVPSKPRYGCRALPEPAAADLARTAANWEGPAGLAVMIGLYAGLRNDEIASLRWEQLDLVHGWIRLVGKQLVTREVPVHHKLAERLAPLARSSGYVFPGSRGRSHVTKATIWNWVHLVSQAALGALVAPHQLRHTAIATLNDLTMDLRAAQVFAGHASPQTTVIYTRVSRRRLVAAVEAIDYDKAAKEVS